MTIQTLRTRNTRTAGFDDDFVVQIDGSKFAADTHHSGSTRARIVLAFHAALLEVALARGGNHPGWLILDAPKQHELSQEDFDAYAERLKLVAARHSGRVQIVFSVADLKTQIEVTDEVWLAGLHEREGRAALSRTAGDISIGGDLREGWAGEAGHSEAFSVNEGPLPATSFANAGAIEGVLKSEGTNVTAFSIRRREPWVFW